MKDIRKNFKTIKCCLLLAIAIMFSFNTALAEAPYLSYTYDSWDRPVETSIPYTVEGVYYGHDFSDQKLNNPRDLFVDSKDNIYILDAGNNRVLVLDSAFNLKRQLRPYDMDKNEMQFTDAGSIFVNDRGQILITDSGAQLVYIFSRDLVLEGQIGSPDSGLLPPDFYYRPVNVLQDSGGITYVISEGCYSGALQFDTDYSFLGFYGSERIVATGEVIADYFWKQILSSKQSEGLKRIVPVEFTSFDIDEQDFIYTIRRGQDTVSGEVRKLNALGQNILPDAVFGDIGLDKLLLDICVDDQGFISIIDGKSGRLFQYDQEGNLLYVFGGQGSQAGTFKSPTAIATIGGRLMVLDKDNASITVFKPTDFALNIRKALLLHHDGKYSEAMEPWNFVLDRDVNYRLANIGIGKAYEGLEDYKSAMYHYRLGHEKDRYSGAFGKYRTSLIRDNFLLFFLAVIAIVLVPIMVARYRGKTIRDTRGNALKPSQYPVYCLKHPFDGYAELKLEGKSSLSVANVILLMFFIVYILERQLTGFAFNHNRVDQFNLLVTAGKSLGLFVAFVLCNWAITTIIDGKGKPKEIWVFCSYALVPYIITALVGLLLTNVMTLEESAFLTMVKAIGYLLFAASFISAVKEVHMFTTGRTLATIALTLAGMLILLIVFAILYSIFNQLLSFITTLYSELLLR